MTALAPAETADLSKAGRIEWRLAWGAEEDGTTWIKAFRGYWDGFPLPVTKFFYCNGLRLYYVDGDVVSKKTEAAVLAVLRRVS